MAISANPAAPTKGPHTLAQALLFHKGARHRPSAAGEQVRSALDSPAGRAGVWSDMGVPLAGPKHAGVKPDVSLARAEFERSHRLATPLPPHPSM